MADYASAMNMDGAWERLSNLGKIFEEAQKARALKEAYAGADFANPQGLSALANRVGAVDPQRALSIASLAQQHYLHSPEHVSKIARAKAMVEQEFAPKTTNIKLPSGEEVTVEKGPNGYRVPPIQGMETATATPGIEIPPGVDPKTYRQERAKKAAEMEQSAAERLGAVRSANDIITRAENAYRELGDRKAIGPISASAPARFYGGMMSGTGWDDLSGAGKSEKLRQDYEAAAKELELMQAQIKMKGQGQITESERKILALTLPRLDAADVSTGLVTLKGVRKQIEDMRTEAESLKPKIKAANPNAWRTRENVAAARADQAGTIAQAKAIIQAKPEMREEVIRRLRESGIKVEDL